MMWLIKELAPMAAIIGAIMTVFILLCVFLPTEAFFVTFFALLLVFGILACWNDNRPRKLQDGNTYCSPSYLKKD